MLHHQKSFLLLRCFSSIDLIYIFNSNPCKINQVEKRLVQAFHAMSFDWWFQGVCRLRSSTPKILLFNGSTSKFESTVYTYGTISKRKYQRNNVAFETTWNYEPGWPKTTCSTIAVSLLTSSNFEAFLYSVFNSYGSS